MNAPPITPGAPTEELLKVRDLRKRFAVKGGIFSRTVDQVHCSAPGMVARLRQIRLTTLVPSTCRMSA